MECVNANAKIHKKQNKTKKNHICVYVGCNGGSICKASSHKAIWLFGSQQEGSR